LNATFNGELLVVIPPLPPERLDPRLHEDQGWGEYWRNDTGSSRLLYNLIAAFYRKVIIRPALNRSLRRHFAPGSHVLHAGCGSGQVDVDVRRHVQVTALDISPPALEAYRRVNGKDVDVLHGSIFDVPLAAASVDGIYNLGVMEHFTEAEIGRILGEFRRLLRPGARVVMFWPPEFGLSVLFFKALKVVLGTLWGRKDVKFHPDEITRLRSKAHARTLVEGAGLEMVDYGFGPRDLFTYAVVVARVRASA
jgi:SAM-dependent methyltransferase